jgi:hypothetical protein
VRPWIGIRVIVRIDIAVFRVGIGAGRIRIALVGVDIAMAVVMPAVIAATVVVDIGYLTCCRRLECGCK